MQQKHAAFGAIAFGGRLEGVDQMHQRPIQAIDRVAMLGSEFREEFVAGEFFLIFKNVLGAV